MDIKQNLKNLLAPFYDMASCDTFGAATDILLSGIKLDHREILPGDMFVALQGHNLDAREYIPAAINAGAVAVLADAGEVDGACECCWQADVPVIAFPHLTSQLSEISARFYQYPSKSMTTIGVTGTNGKTTVTQLLAQWIDLANGKTAVMGTAGNGFSGALEPAVNTTGSPVDIQAQLAQFYQAKASHVAMEVSSHGLVQERVKAIIFDAVIFTNLSRDHLDYHGTMDAYADAKRRLFTDNSESIAVICADDPVGQQWLKSMPNSIAVSMSKAVAETHSGPTLYLTSVDYTPNAVTVAFASDWGDGEFITPLLGEFNVMNLLLSLATLLALGFAKEQLLLCAPQLQPVIGRMEIFQQSDKPMFVVDYAHTPDALEKALHALRRHCQGSLWCVFGCGGDRDIGKRPMMAAIAENFADKLVLTDDNPRSESPRLIISHMQEGMAQPQNAIVVHDRSQACRYAFEHALKNDVILVAGKGHEDYQVLASRTIRYSDRDTVRHLLEGEA